MQLVNILAHASILVTSVANLGGGGGGGAAVVEEIFTPDLRIR